MGLFTQALRNARYGLAKNATPVEAVSLLRLEFDEVAYPKIGEVASSRVHLKNAQSVSLRLLEGQGTRKSNEVALLPRPRIAECLAWPTLQTGRIRHSEFRFFSATVQDRFSSLDHPSTQQIMMEALVTHKRAAWTSCLPIDPPFRPAQCHLAFALARPGIADGSYVLEKLTRVSENLFRPLGKTRSDGKDYGTRGLHQTKLDLDQRPKSEEYKRSYAERKTRGTGAERQVMTVWDLLFPLLQPPPFDVEHQQQVFLPAELLPHQPKGVHFLASHQAALLGDGVQTGKTIQSVVAMKLLFQTGCIHSALIVCPIPLLIHWQKQLEKWAPELWQGLTVVRSTSKDQRRIMWRMPAHVHATNFETLVADFGEVCAVREGKGFSLIVVDEIQRLKNRRNAFDELTHLGKLAEYRWGLSATPLEGKLDDVVAIFEFLKPRLLRRDTENEQTVQRKIAPYFLRRRTADVLKDFKEPRHDHAFVQMEGTQLKAYDAAFSESVAELRHMGETVTLTHALAKLQALKQLCNVHLASGQSAKADWLLDKLEGIVSAGDNALVFTQYDPCGYNFLESRLSRFGCVNYGKAKTDVQKRYAVSEFTNDPTKHVFLANPMNAGVGMPDLKKANYVFHFDHWWNPAIIDQANGRILGYGQQKEAFVVHLWVENSIEGRIQAILARKRGLFERVIDSQTNVGGTGLTEEELFEVFGLTPPVRKASATATPTRQRTDSLQPTNHNEWTPGTLSQISPEEFEELTADLYKAMGFAAQRTKQSRDGGIDVIAIRDLALGRDKLAIQCKHQLKPVGRPELQKLLGVISSDGSFSAGVIVTTSTFSADAIRFAAQNATLRLIDGRALLQLLNDHCRQPARATRVRRVPATLDS
jgi:hypothetical protein